MNVLRGFGDLDLDLDAPAVTIGNFDGVHRGHRAVIEHARAEADRRHVACVVCTFDPHTARVLRPDRAPPNLDTLEQRLAAIGAFGVDLTVIIPFDRSVADTPHEEFVDRFLLAELSVGTLHVSKGFSFGRDHAGSTAYLERRARESSFRVFRVPAVLVDGVAVSSTRIRADVAAGRVEQAARLLGRPYAVIGQVVAGAGRGRSMGSPTANLELQSECLPAAGVYATLVAHQGVEHVSATNIGTRPTFGGSAALQVETHLLDWDGDLYGQSLEVRFIARLRSERKFASPDALGKQIRLDIEQARRVLGDHALTAGG